MKCENELGFIDAHGIQLMIFISWCILGNLSNLVIFWKDKRIAANHQSQLLMLVIAFIAHSSGQDDPFGTMWIIP
jgi:hypothetical protein